MDSNNRKSLSSETIRILRSQSAGFCQNPSCNNDLLSLTDSNISQLAHIIPASLRGPRGDVNKDMNRDERARHTNILLLCPTCHNLIDKDPKTYTASTLRSWKDRSLEIRSKIFGIPEFANRNDARCFIEKYFDENFNIFKTYGPEKEDPVLEDVVHWRQLVVDKIIPNNEYIINFLDKNFKLLNSDEKEDLAELKIHTLQLKARHLDNNWIGKTVRFPQKISEILG